MNRITFDVNNGRTLELEQDKHDGAVMISHGLSGRLRASCIVPAGEMVQLVNLYRYVKRYNIADSFINPDGQNVERAGTIQPAQGLSESSNGHPVPQGQEPLPVWFIVLQDGDAGYHIYRRPVDSNNPDPEKREDINKIIENMTFDFVENRGGCFIAAWPANQVVEIADIADFPFDIHD